MWRTVCYIFSSFLLQYAVGFDYDPRQMCGNNTQQRARGCTTQILGHNNSDVDTCTVEYYPPDSPQCKAMNFQPIQTNSYIGGVNLKPYIMRQTFHDVTTNFTVLNITFSNIKWKTMKFRFQLSKQKRTQNHCRNIVLSNDVTINEQSVLYYDCYWSVTDGNYNGQSHVLDFEATDDRVVNRGQYYFNIPTAEMLSPTVTEEEWLPFLYIEILTGNMRLHIMPPLSQLNITTYEVKVMKEVNNDTQFVQSKWVTLRNITQEVTYDYSLLHVGSYYFIVTPLHDKCLKFKEGCRSVESPRIVISNEVQTMSICIASMAAFFVATLFAYYIALRLVRKYWCREYTRALNEIPCPTKVLVIYSSRNAVHAQCVASLVKYLRSEYGFDVIYDGDITTDMKPDAWAAKAVHFASHILYVAGPKKELTNGINVQAIVHPYRDVDLLLLNCLSRSRLVQTKQAANVFFDYSKREVPSETLNDRSFYLLKDWEKMVAYLSNNLLSKKKMPHETGKGSFPDVLRYANEVLV